MKELEEGKAKRFEMPTPSSTICADACSIRKVQTGGQAHGKAPQEHPLVRDACFS
jgi:hypothetical protein